VSYNLEACVTMREQLEQNYQTECFGRFILLMKELCSEDENSSQSPMRMGPELVHEMLQNIMAAFCLRTLL
jgi:hypothetical protein